MNFYRLLGIFALVAGIVTQSNGCAKDESLAPQLEKLVEARKTAEATKRIVLGEKSEQKRREIELLVNIIAPDPEYQPWYLADEADLFAVRDQGERTLRPRLEGYFGKPLKVEIEKRQPLWELVDELKKHYPDWPDGWD